MPPVRAAARAASGGPRNVYCLPAIATPRVESAPSRFAVAMSALRSVEPTPVHGKTGPRAIVPAPNVTSPAAARTTGRTRSVPTRARRPPASTATACRPGSGARPTRLKAPRRPECVRAALRPSTSSVTPSFPAAKPRTRNGAPGASHAGSLELTRGGTARVTAGGGPAAYGSPSRTARSAAAVRMPRQSPVNARRLMRNPCSTAGGVIPRVRRNELCSCKRRSPLADRAGAQSPLRKQHGIDVLRTCRKPH